FDVTDGVATITLNRPDSLNAFTTAMIAETADALKQCGRDAAVRCVVITGAGRGFTAGQDLAEVQGRGDEFSIGPHLRAGYH
ncbi:MAG: enoyl-CoA hydratase/isomerase family protein, partial [Anaerolineae bacterium]|nr:enoyl-CoA hydratase/isomerase family protein [Anaerolineae bacterium]